MTWSVTLSGDVAGAVDDVVKEEQAILAGLQSLVDGITSRAKSSLAGGRFFGSFVVHQDLAGGGDPVVVLPTPPVTEPVVTGPVASAEVPPADAPLQPVVADAPVAETPAPDVPAAAAVPESAPAAASEEPAPA